MHLSRFKEAARIHRQKQAYGATWPLILACLCSLLWMPFYNRAKERLEERVDLSTANFIAVLPVAASITIGMALLIPLARRVERKFAVLCQHCGKSLTDAPSIVIASKHCPHCGERVIDEAT